VRAYLFHGTGAPPPEYIDLVLCRDIYHCPPSLLDDQDWLRIQGHLTCLDMEATVREHKTKVAQAKSRRRR
jgi:hypothetical protein